MYVTGGMVVACYLALWIISRREVVEQKVGPFLRPFYKISVWIYKKACIRRITLFSSAQVERDLRSLHPEEGREQQITKYYIQKISLFLVVMFTGTLFGMLVRYNSQISRILDDEGGIVRGNYRDGSVKVQLKAECGEGESGSFEIEIAPVLLAEKEARDLAEEFLIKLPELILGDNESLDRITYDLVLEESYEGYPFLLEWKSSRPAVVGSTGRVYPGEEAVPAEMTVRITYGEMIREETLHLKVVPEVLTIREQEHADLEELLLQSEYDSRSEEVWNLPEEWQGKEVYWQQKIEDYSMAVWILTIVTAVSVYAIADQDLHRQQEQRKKQMQREYPDIVHKLALYIGAGMTTRGAFQKIATDYGQKKCGKDSDPAYEEMLYACRELRSGVSEASAYEHFGKRTGLQEYIRLSSMLAQNLKKGNSALPIQLREEAARAGTERLQGCKRLGEEAGTKLLAPMVLMLLVVMVMIMIPAFSSM